MHFKQIQEKVNDNFSSKHKKGHIFQSSYWAHVKKNWNSVYIGGFDDSNNLILTCVLLVRKIPFTNKFMGYIPRGVVCDYLNSELVKAFTNYLRNYCYLKEIAFITMDPDIPLCIDNTKIEAGEKAAEILEGCGLIRRTSVDFEQIQARHVMRLSLPEVGESEEQVKEKVFQCFSSKTRYNIHVAERRGLIVESYDSGNLTKEALDIFYELMLETAVRDKFVCRGKEYFSNLMKELYPNAKLYLVSYDINRDVQENNKKMKDLMEEINFRNKKGKNIEEIHNRIETLKKRNSELEQFLSKKKLYLSGSICGFYARKAWYLYGASSNKFRNTMPNYIMQWQMIQDCIKRGCNLYDFRGVPGNIDPNNPLYGLYTFKKGFGSKYEEFIGEFYLVNNKKLYNIYVKGLPIFRKLRSPLVKLKRRIVK